MSSEKVQLTQEKETLLMTLYARALDSRHSNPILADPTAADTISRIDYDFSRLLLTVDDAAGIAMRTQPFDSWTRRFITHHPDAVVVHLGCGLDNRIQRLQPPTTTTWYELDFPDVIALRERLYGQVPNRNFLPSSVTDHRWLDQIPSDRPTLILAEGLLPYLTYKEAQQLLARIAEHISTGELACDLLSRTGKLLLQRRNAIATTGATLRWAVRHPRELENWHPTIRLTGSAPLTTREGRRNMTARYRFISQLPAIRHLMHLAHYTFT